MSSYLAATGAGSIDELAQTKAIREAMRWFTREKQWINELHLELCRIPAPTFLEHQRAEWIAGQFRSFGWEVQIDRAGNVLAFLDPTWRGPFVALTAHLDTVLAPKTKEDVSVSADGRFVGPGVSDNGAGLAALLAIAKALKTGPPLESSHSSLVMVANVGEEGEGNLSGMRHICRPNGLAKRICSFIVLDGAATEHITIQALGSRRFEVSFTGPGGHSWSDYGTGNPVHALSRAVSLISDVKLNGNPRSSLNVGILEGGTGVNAIPAAAKAKVDIRSESNQKMDELVGLLAEAVDRAQSVENERSVTGKVTGRIREIGSRPAGRIPDGAAVLEYLKAVDAYLGIRSHFDCASTDANVPLSLGIPAVSIGAGGQGGGAHTTQEWFLPERRDLALKRILLTLGLLMRDAQVAEGCERRP